MKIVLKILEWILVIALVAFATWFLISFCKYRLSIGGAAEETYGVVHYKFLELNFTNRQVFEELMGNRIIRIEDYPPFYVSKKDRAKLWPENPHEMRKKGYSIKAKILSTSLTFGGFGYSRVLETEVINEKPIIRK
jgi:hypothetical protein